MKSVAENFTFIGHSFLRQELKAAREEVARIRQSLDEEKKIQIRLENAVNQTQLKFLESQVNPHFLFNTLNTIAQQAVLDDAEKVASLTYSLADLLRMSLGKNKSLIPIREEMACVRSYLFIQSARFPTAFAASIHVDPDVESMPIPLMTIMVLVENAILHGFQNIKYKGELTVRITQAGGQVKIEVVDNGRGISDDVVRIVRELPYLDYDQVPLPGLGIKNIFLRLRHYYGDHFTFKMEKQEEGGTAVLVLLPPNVAD